MVGLNDLKALFQPVTLSSVRREAEMGTEFLGICY